MAMESHCMDYEDLEPGQLQDKSYSASLPSTPGTSTKSDTTLVPTRGKPKRVVFDLHARPCTNSKVLHDNEQLDTYYS